MVASSPGVPARTVDGGRRISHPLSDPATARTRWLPTACQRSRTKDVGLARQLAGPCRWQEPDRKGRNSCRARSGRNDAQPQRLRSRRNVRVYGRRGSEGVPRVDPMCRPTWIGLSMGTLGVGRSQRSLAIACRSWKQLRPDAAPRWARRSRQWPPRFVTKDCKAPGTRERNESARNPREVAR
jgi:hypothetical protein